VGPIARIGRGGEEKNSQLLPGFEPPVIQRVVEKYTTELSRLKKKKKNDFSSIIESFQQLKGRIC
jgi:hypothetical protein